MSDWTGILELEAGNHQGKTITKNAYFQGAFKIMRPVYHQNSNQPCYYLLNPGGGYLDGDTYRLSVTLGEKAQATVTTQSSTKVYKTPNSPVYQETEFFLKKDSFLEYLPDPLIAYKDARYIQKNIVHMEKGATLLYSDILTPGWSPDGNLFSYDSLRLINEIYLDDELVAFDHIKLNPNEQNMDGIGIMEGYTHLGTFTAVSEKADSELLDLLYETIQQETEDFKAGLSELSTPGFTIRVLAKSTQVIERIFRKCHHIISMKWFQKEPGFLRKY